MARPQQDREWPTSLQVMEAAVTQPLRLRPPTPPLSRTFLSHSIQARQLLVAATPIIQLHMLQRRDTQDPVDTMHHMAWLPPTGHQVTLTNS